MSAIELLAFALFTGITVCGVAGSLLELVAERQLSFSEPFLSRAKVAWTVLATVTAGPMMLANDALNARRAGTISPLLLGSCACTALLWALAMGVVVLETVLGIVALV